MTSKTDTVEIRVTARAQNAILARLVDESGSIKAAAREVGVSGQTYSHWLNFRTRMIPGGNGRGGLSFERFKKVVVALERLTGRNIRDIFPLSRDEMALINRPRVVEKTIQRARLTSAVERKYLTYVADVEDRLELQDCFTDSLLNRLSHREREIIKLRYGLGDGRPLMLKEVGHIFKVSKERIREIEAKALRRLMQFLKCEGKDETTFDLVPEGVCRWCRERFANVFAMNFHEKNCPRKREGNRCSFSHGTRAKKS